MASEQSKQRRLSLTIESRLDQVLLVSLAVRGICRDTLSDQEVAGQMELCVVEAVNNAIKHAYDCRPGYEVLITIALSADRIVFTVNDYGRAMAEVNTKEPDFDPDDLAGLPESGMGLFIIQSAMDLVDYRSKDGRNTMTMTKIVPTIS
jgi:serine/threonine-protein kinase RsbW